MRLLHTGVSQLQLLFAVIREELKVEEGTAWMALQERGLTMELRAIQDQPSCI